MKELSQIFKHDIIKNTAEHCKIYFNNSVGFLAKMGRIINGFLIKNYRLLLALLLMILIPVFVRILILQIDFSNEQKLIANQEEIPDVKEKTYKEIKALEKKLAAKTPRSYYVVINSASNEFSLYKGMQLIKTDKCSTGSYILLKNGDEQEWMFKTPKGEFRIQGKTTSPVWKKPDWAFIEEGLPVPSSNHYSRFESGVLGDFALSLGDGYLIHGTLYQRFLGLPVTHGCIRLNDANLALVYNSLSVGSKVYIF